MNGGPATVPARKPIPENAPRLESEEHAVQTSARAQSEAVQEWVALAGEKARLMDVGKDRLWSQLSALIQLEFRLLRGYARLVRWEAKLRERARRKVARSGPNAVQQVERERERLGRELHTGVGQTLAAMRLQLEMLSGQLPSATPSVQSAVGRLSTLAGEALDQVRSVSRRLHPPEWQRLRLETALEQLWELSGIPQNLEAKLEIEKLPLEPEFESKVLIYRAAQEAISNLTRHSRATRASMLLSMRDGNLVLQVQDNGVGFDPNRLFSAPPDLGAGIGLRALRDQASGLGGKLKVESGRNGTTLEITIPCSPVSG